MLRKILTKLLVILTLALLLMPGALYAQFEPAIQIDGVNTGPTPQMVPSGNIDAVITPTTADTTGYTLERYVFIWNNSDTALTDDQLGPGDSSVPQGDPIVISTDAKTQFGNSDGDSWYLHVKTVYFSTADGTALSNDTIAGPYTFDGVAPTTATIALDTSVDGQTVDTASGSPVTLEVSGPSDIKKVYVNTAEIFSTAKEYDFSDPATTTLTYAVTGTGSKTLYAWFEDTAGNISSPAYALTFTINAGKSMDPAGDLTLGIGNTQDFQISGAGAEAYTWTIVDADDVTKLSSAASVVSPGAYTAVVTGVSPGTVKVKAETNGTDPIFSGIVTVQQMGYTITHFYKKGLNLVPFSLTGTGISNASDLRSAIENANSGLSVSQIFGWDATSQAYSTAYVVVDGTGYFDFPLVAGAAYFVQTDGTGSLDLSGSDFSSISISKGLNLLSAPYSKLNSIETAADFALELSNNTGLSISQIFGWDASNQAYSTAYVVVGGNGYFDFNLAIGAQGYFVQLSGDGTYKP